MNNFPEYPLFVHICLILENNVVSQKLLLSHLVNPDLGLDLQTQTSLLNIDPLKTDYFEHALILTLTGTKWSLKYSKIH